LIEFAYVFLILPAIARLHKFPETASARNTYLSVVGGQCCGVRIGIAPKSFMPISFPYLDYVAAVSFFGISSLKIV